MAVTAIYDPTTQSSYTTTTVTATSTVVTDTISEYTSAAGVTIDSLLLKDGTVVLAGVAKGLCLDTGSTSWIEAATANTIDIYLASAKDFTFTANTLTALSGSTIATNTIAETTATSGVTVDSLLIKDGGFTGAGAGSIGAQFRSGTAFEKMTQTAVTDTATITAAQMLTKVLDGTPTAGATYTLDTAANLVAALTNATVGDSFLFFINNKSAGANTITVAAGSGGSADGTLTVAQNVIRAFLVIVTNVTASSEAYFVYGLGA